MAVLVLLRIVQISGKLSDRVVLLCLFFRDRLAAAVKSDDIRSEGCIRGHLEVVHNGQRLDVLVFFLFLFLLFFLVLLFVLRRSLFFFAALFYAAGFFTRDLLLFLTFGLLAAGLFTAASGSLIGDHELFALFRLLRSIFTGAACVSFCLGGVAYCDFLLGPHLILCRLVPFVRSEDVVGKLYS